MEESTARKPLKRRCLLRDEIREAILEAIYANELNPGDRIVETQWAKDLGVSKAPVREAIRELEVMGMLENRPFQGAVVRRLTTKDVKDAYQVRKSLEVFGCRLAARLITQEELEDVYRILQEMEEAARSAQFERYIEIDTFFHETIMQIADNELLLRVWKQSKIAEWTWLVTKMTNQSLELLAARHESIYKALEKHDEEQAERAAALHLDELVDDLVIG